MSPNKLIIDAVSATVNKDNKEYKNKSSAYLASLRYELRRMEKGLCGRFGCKNPASQPGKRYSSCKEHKEKRREYWRGYRERKKKSKEVL